MPIPVKRYFTIGEVSDLCGVKPHVLRYWEQEFTQLRPMKRRGNRRYYQHHEVLMIRRIRALLYDQGFTISGARNKLHENVQTGQDKQSSNEIVFNDAKNHNENDFSLDYSNGDLLNFSNIGTHDFQAMFSEQIQQRLRQIRTELFEIRELLNPSI